MSPSRHVLSVLVVTLNEAPRIPLLKGALDDLSLPPGWTLETILVDGGSTDSTPDVARELSFDRVLVLPGASIPGASPVGRDCIIVADDSDLALSIMRRILSPHFDIIEAHNGAQSVQIIRTHD